MNPAAPVTFVPHNLSPAGGEKSLSPLAFALQQAFPELKLSPEMNAEKIITHLCTDPITRDLNKLGAALQPFANAALINTLLDLSRINEFASNLLDVLMSSILRDQRLDKPEDSVDNKKSGQPFGYVILGSDVLVSLGMPKRMTKMEFYRMWAQSEGNLHHMQARMSQHINFDPVTQPVFGANYRVKTSLAFVSDQPEKVLSALSEVFDKRNAQILVVNFENEKGVDAGGLRRQFVCDLVKSLCGKLKFRDMGNGLFRPCSRNENPTYPCLSEGDKKVYQDLGKLIMFCLNAAEEYPTGPIFDPGTFVALVRMDPKLLDRKFEEIDFQDPKIFASLFDLYMQMHEFHEEESKGLLRRWHYLSLSATNHETRLQEAFASVMTDESIERLGITIDQVDRIRQNLPAIQAAVKTELIERMRATFAPIHAIATGMKSFRFASKCDFSAVQCMNPNDLSNQIQKNVLKQDIISKIRFDLFHKTDIIKSWFTNWINKADDKKLELFLYAVSGSSGLGSNSQIKVMHSKSFAFHTSGCQMEMNFDEVSNENDFAACMDAHLDLIKHNSGYNMA